MQSLKRESNEFQRRMTALENPVCGSQQSNLHSQFQDKYFARTASISAPLFKGSHV